MPWLFPLSSQQLRGAGSPICPRYVPPHCSNCGAIQPNGRTISRARMSPSESEFQSPQICPRGADGVEVMDAASPRPYTMQVVGEFAMSEAGEAVKVRSSYRKQLGQWAGTIFSMGKQALLIWMWLMGSSHGPGSLQVRIPSSSS